MTFMTDPHTLPNFWEFKSHF